MKVNETFLSCQGEGVSAGLPTVFVRLQGCNLYPNGVCKYCDTVYAQNNGGREMSPHDVVVKAEEISNGCRRVCITGGEPLHQAVELYGLIDLLKFRERYVEIFTNATLLPPSWFNFADCWVADVKCPSSGVQSHVSDWLLFLRGQDQLKFTVGTPEDLEYVRSVLGTCEHVAQVIVSPVLPNAPSSMFGDILMFKRLWLQTVWDFCIKNNLRFSFQLHKLAFGNRRGI